jgi:hypothetical protein
MPAVEAGRGEVLVGAERRARDDTVLTGALLAAASMRAVQSELIPILVATAGHHAPLCWFSWQQQSFLLKQFKA